MLPDTAIRSINEFLEHGFERQLFAATQVQVAREDDPLRANNFAYALRELSRHVLARLSPDEDVIEAPWYTPVMNDRQQVTITRAQRMKFAIQGNLTDEFMQQQLKIDYGEEIRSLIAAIDELNKYTHIGPKTFNVPPEEVARLCGGAVESFAEVLRSTFDCRERTLQAVSAQVDQTVLQHIVDETLEGFWELATHYTIDDVHIDTLTCTGFEGHEIYGTVEGTISVILQYGSDVDRRRGDGLEMDESASFTCEVTVSANDLSDISLVEGSLDVDYEKLRESWGDDDWPFDL